jgi:hypothetical protein
MLAGPRAHPDLAVRLRPVEPRSARVGKELPPTVVDEDHQLRDELVERTRARARDDPHASTLDRPQWLIPVDMEAVIDTREIRLATLAREPLGELPQRAQLFGPRRFAGCALAGEGFADRVEPQVRGDRHALDAC